MTTDQIDVTDKIMSRLLELIPGDSGMKLPPNIFCLMGGVFLEFIEHQCLVVRFPNREEYMNPVGFMQGGIITAAIDNTISPLSYTLGPQNVTQVITTTFKRPVTKADRFIDVTATVGEIAEKGIRLGASVRNEQGKLVATAEAYCVYIKPRTCF